MQRWKRRGHTAPAQKMWLGHHAWVGGSGTWDGRVAERATDGLATAVEMVTVGGEVALLGAA